MDKIAIISDIHGNMPALRAVLEDIEKKDISKIICLGDLVGKGPEPDKVIDVIREKTIAVTMGNWDQTMASDCESRLLDWTREKIGKERLNYLGSLPNYVEFYMSGKLVRLFHAAPEDVFFRTYIESPVEDRLKLFEATPTIDKKSDIVGYGDIHGAHITYVEKRTVFNVGSVGNPLDTKEASYAIMEGTMDDEVNNSIAISIVRVPYDIEEAVSIAQASDMLDIKEYVKELRTAEYRGKNSFRKYV